MEAEAFIQLLTPLLEKLFGKVIDKIGQSDGGNTIGTSEIVQHIDMVNENITCTNYILALIVIFLIFGWLYSFFKDLTNQV